MALSKSARTLISGLTLTAILLVGFLWWRGLPPFQQVITITVHLVDDPNGGCIIDSSKHSKTESVTVEGESRQVLWSVNHDNCKDKQAVVTLGNFRRSAASRADDCLEARAAGTDGIWLFAQPEALQHRQSHSQIPLTTKRQAELPAAAYYYDMCTGADAEKKFDPRLVIEY